MSIDYQEESYEKPLLTIPEGIVATVGAIAAGGYAFEATNNRLVGLAATTITFIGETALWNKAKDLIQRTEQHDNPRQ